MNSPVPLKKNFARVEQPHPAPDRAAEHPEARLRFVRHRLWARWDRQSFRVQISLLAIAVVMLAMLWVELFRLALGLDGWLGF